jgi:hypothetical protein
MENPILSFKEFNLNDIPETSIVCITGSQSKYDPDKPDPKTLIICDMVDKLFYTKKGIKGLLIVSPLRNSFDHYKNFYPDAEIYREFDIDAINDYLKTAHDFVDKKKSDFRGCVVLDGLNLYLNDKFKETLYNLIFDGRHHRISIFITGLISLPLEIRMNADYVFAYKTYDTPSIKKLHEFCNNEILPIDCFKNFLIDFTENDGALVIDNRTRSELLTDKIFKYTIDKNVF